MSGKYLGEVVPDIKDTPFADYKPSDWALYLIASYGQTDGGHHKQWVLDQVARVLHGTPVIVKLARWEDEQEWRVNLDEPSDDYKDWVEELKEWDEQSDEYIYGYDTGIAP